LLSISGPELKEQSILCSIQKDIDERARSAAAKMQAADPEAFLVVKR
jgi:hypothetical protein